jgi:hypothetical protein
MATQNGLPSADASAPPFATKDGLPTVKDGGSGKAAMPMSRPQPSGPPQLDIDNSQTPKGGPVLMADPTGPSGAQVDVHGVSGEVPFKNLK